MKQIRLVPRRNGRPEMEAAWPSDVWAPDTARSRAALTVLAEIGNSRHGPDSYRIEERDVPGTERKQKQQM